MEINKKIPLKYILDVYKKMPGYPSTLDVYYDLKQYEKTLPKKESKSIPIKILAYLYPKTDKSTIKTCITELESNKLITINSADKTLNIIANIWF